MIGDRIRLARNKSGLSLRALASMLDEDCKVSAQAIGKYERSEMTPSGDVLVELADKLGVALDFLLDPEEIQISGVEFRAKSNSSVKDLAQVEASVIEWVQKYLQLETLLELKSAEWSEPVAPRIIRDITGAETLAEDVRKAWKLGQAPISNVTELLEEKGLKICILDLPMKVSGMTCLVNRGSSDEKLPVVVVNENYPLERRRMTLLHELGHRLIAPHSPLSHREEEKLATRFGSALLMPSQHVYQEVGRHRQALGYCEIMELKKIYRVSAAAFVYRLKDLGIISESMMTYFFQSTGSAWRTNEPEPIEVSTPRLAEKQELPKRFERLCYRALSEKLISEAKAAYFLNKSLGKIQVELKGPRDVLPNGG